MNPISSSQEVSIEATETLWEDWFEAEHGSFTVQASLEADLLTNRVFKTIQPVLKSKLSALLAAFADTAKAEHLLSVHQLAEPATSAQFSWDFEWMLCTNATIQAWNSTYRQKESPTDVLSFPTFETEATRLEATEDALAIAFLNQQKQAGGSLGTIVVSWEYAYQAIQALEAEPSTPAFQEKLTTYLLERFCHGCLHLLGLHHETDEKYNRVITLQAQTLAKLTD